MAQVDPATAYPESPMESEDIYTCKGCGEILEEGKAFELAGNRWHINCFRCGSCATLLDSDANLLLLGDGSLICNACTYSCNACGNKIEDLAILTGDQAFCSACFRCRNCKRRIENLRYARTSQGIFCMSCHESLMARRRKRSKQTSKSGQAGAQPQKEKALPSLPPTAASENAFSPDVETPPSEDATTTPGARQSSERQYLGRPDVPSKSMRRDRSPMSDDASTGMSTLVDLSSLSAVADAKTDGPTLPASTYGQPSRLEVAHESDEEAGYLPMAFDPTPVATSSTTRKPVPTSQSSSPLTRNGPLPRDYFGGSSTKVPGRDLMREEQAAVSPRPGSRDRDPLLPSSQAKANQHILSQAKTHTSASTSAAASPLAPSNRERTERVSPRQADISTFASSQNEAFRLQEVPKSKRAGSGRSSRAAASPNESKSKDERALKATSRSSDSSDSPSSSINPFDDLKRKEAGGLSAVVPPARSVDRPVRGDSLTNASRHTTSSTPETQTSASILNQLAPNRERKGSLSSVSGTFVDAQSTLSRGNSDEVADETSGPTVFSAPPPRASSRPTAQSKALADASSIESRTLPPPLPPPVSLARHKNNDSISTMHSDVRFEEPLTPGLRGSAGLPKHSMDGAFSLEEEMARIMNRESTDSKKDVAEVASPSMLRKVSNAVKHGRSFSDRPHSSKKSTSSIPPDIGTPVSISSPIMTSPTYRDTTDSLAAQLKRAQLRIAELESDVNRLEEKVNSSTEIKAASNELKEKRTTIVVLDTQREMVVRELEAMTERLAKVKDSNKPLDLKTLKSDIQRDFAESLQKLKEQMSGQIEDLMRKRNDLTDEITNLIQMKDKGFQEYEILSSKNAQLLEMNNQILHNIQEMYKSNRGQNGMANVPSGLGIYHPDGRVETPGPSDVRNLNLVNTDPSLPQILQETEAEPATVLTAPQVVNIRKGQPKKFNWRKGGEKMAKNVTKGLKGAFVGERVTPLKDGDGAYSIGVPYNQTQAAAGSDQGSLSSKQNFDAGRSGSNFGLFGQKPGTLKAGSSALSSMKDTSSTNLITDPSVLFGSELSDRCDFEKRLVPCLVSKCIDEVESRGMDVEGIYRKSGGSGQVKQVQQSFERDYAGADISDPDLDIHSITSTLKQYFRKLPTPLITYDVYDLLLDAGGVTETEKRCLALRAAVEGLPEAHRECLEVLIRHLVRVMAYEKENLMTPLNLAVVFAPTIMRPLSIEREMTDMLAQRLVLQGLLEGCEGVFGEE